MVSRGELEQQVMVLLWRAGEPLTVADVQELLARERDLAYTTVMTVLDRLAKKGLARRERGVMSQLIRSRWSWPVRWSTFFGTCPPRFVTRPCASCPSRCPRLPSPPDRVRIMSFGKIL